jgi:hypothetical protein
MVIGIIQYLYTLELSHADRKNTAKEMIRSLVHSLSRVWVCMQYALIPVFQAGAGFY